MNATEFLFQNIELWDDPYDTPQIVCIEHKAFIPCRSCMYKTPATVPYSDKFMDVEEVRSYHQ